MRTETAAIHAGRHIDPATQAVMPPVVLSTTFAYNPHKGYEEFLYSRYGNPNRNALEECLCGLEGGSAGVAFASGMAAANAIVHALLKSGDHVLAPEDCYFSMRRLLGELYAPWGLEVTFVDMTNPDAVRAAMRPNTRLLWTETPSNPQLKITDIRAIAAIAYEAGALCICDNTWATPLLQQPLALGCDMVFHSSTKYFGGHSDVTGGIVIVSNTAQERDRHTERLRLHQKLCGAVPSPFDCWLVLRSIATLPQRMKAHCAGARQVAEFLETHPNVEKVHYPGLPTNTFHAIAQQQMSDFGGMVSFEVRGGREAALQVAAATRLFTCATSLGGVESLVEHRASVEGVDSPTPQGLLRLSVGLEHPDDLVADLRRALEHG